ncbi:MAG: LytTR family DNA-binding domain-containing protein [Bacteroidales bacterium]
MQIKAVIIDDEQHSLETTDIMVRKYCPGVLVIGLANSAEKGITLIDTLKPDLVFLDIAMPRMNGFEMLQHLSFRDFNLIFTTAYDDYAIKAFKVEAIDYLLKPIEPEELIKAVEKVKKVMENTLHFSRIDNILQQMGAMGHQRRKLALPIEGKLTMLEYDLIIYCESDGNYTILHLNGEKDLMVSRTLKDIENMLPHPPFLRIHNSYVININHVTQYIRGDGGDVILTNNIQLRVARSRKEELIAALS